MCERLGKDIDGSVAQFETNSIRNLAIVDCAFSGEGNINGDAVAKPLGLTGGRQEACRHTDKRPIQEGLIGWGDESENMRHCGQALSGSGSPLS